MSGFLKPQPLNLKSLNRNKMISGLEEVPKDLDFLNESKEFVEQKLVRSIRVLKKEGRATTLEVVSLEGKVLVVECSAGEGIVLRSVDGKGAGERRSFDSFEQLLSSESKEYTRMFHEKLCEELMKL